MSGPAGVPGALRGASIVSLARAEFRLNARSGGYRFMAAMIAVVVVAAMYFARVADSSAFGVGPTVYFALRWLLELLLLALTPMVAAGAALREHRLAMDEIVQSKPLSSEAIVWGKFLGIYASLLALALVGAVAAVAGSAVLFWPETPVLAALLGALRLAAPILFLAGLSFAAAVASRSVMVSGIVVALHLGVGMAASSFLMPAVRYTLTPYHLSFALFGLALVALIAGTWLRQRDGRAWTSRSLYAVAACVVVGFAANASAAFRWGGYTMAPPVPDVQPDKSGAVPRGLLSASWSDVRGRPVRLGDRPGKPVVVVLWNAMMPSTALEAAAVERGWREVGADRVAFFSACIAEDPGRASDMAVIAGLRQPVIWNPPMQDEATRGLVAALGSTRDPIETFGVLIYGNTLASDQMCRRPAAVVRRPPHRDWERRLQEMAADSFRRLAQREQ